MLMVGVTVSCMSAVGCGVKQELPDASYGKVVDKFPDLPEAKKPYQYPVEMKHLSSDGF